MNRTLDIITLVLLIIGGLNWLLAGWFQFDVAAEIAGLEFGRVNWFNGLIYTLVGLSAIYQAAIARQVRTERARVSTR